MNYKIRVIEYPNGKERELYRNTISVPDGVLFPFDDLVKVLRLLYPRATSVEISILY